MLEVIPAAAADSMEGVLGHWDRPKTEAEWRAVVETVLRNEKEIQRIIKLWNTTGAEYVAQYQDSILIHYLSLFDELLQMKKAPKAKLIAESSEAAPIRKLLCR